MKKLILLSVLFLSVNMLSQNNFGKAYYQSQTTISADKVIGDNIDEDTKKLILDQLREKNQKNYILLFNKNESLYKEEEKLQPETNKGMIVIGGASSGKQYKNISSNTFIEEKDFLGKQFLISDTIPKLDWKLENQSKQIGQYTAFKATALKSTKNLFKQDSTTLKKNILVTAWYTPQIPISNGPGEYGGLPGLILELNIQRTTILCNKIILNPKETIQIKPPTNGKKVTRNKYNAIVAKKMQEMQSDFIPGQTSGFKLKN